MAKLKDTVTPRSLLKNAPESSKWFQNVIDKKITKANVNTDKIIKKASTDKNKRIQIGKLYLFKYDPKTKEELPYYDIFPLIFIVKKAPGGFMGINIHYLPPYYRAVFMDALLNLASDKNKSNMTKLRITYQILNSTSKLRLYKVCLKRYLNSHVKTNFIEIPYNDWLHAVFLPLQSFKKLTLKTVYLKQTKLIKSNTGLYKR